MKNKHDFSLALVTGASSGIGMQLCHLLAEEGIDLIITARRTENLQSLAEELGDKVNVEIVTADLANHHQRKELIEKMYERVPDLVVNNAGYGIYGEALTHETQKSMDMLEVDVAAVLEISLEGARALISSEREGVIMNISSSAAFQIFPYFAVYAASKAFVNNFSESFDEEVKHYGVRVLAACPGMVATEFPFVASGGAHREGNPLAMSVGFAASEIWRQILKRKPVHAFDWKYRIATFLSRYLIPKKITAMVMRKTIESRHPKKTIIKRTK
ncbi:MAG: Serine 3-dehydrogenase [Chlamydiae bacterium]|nr:Serine 3-dehydrogenase [Chlamydiota bacterium]